MSKMRIVMFSVAIGSAVAAALLARGMVGKKPEPKVVEAPKIETTDVLVAAKDLEIGEKLAAGSIIWKPWPKNLVRDSMITRDEKPEAETELAESRALSPMFEGETIIDKKYVNPGEGSFMGALVPKGMRAYGMSIRTRTVAGGFIMPNDRVDIILTKKLEGGGSGTVYKSETVLTNVRVLSINQVFKPAVEGEETTIKEGDNATATLELRPEQAEILARLESEGELSLSLRSIAESEGKAVEEGPQLAERFRGNGQKTATGDTLFIRYGIETYGASR